MKRIILLITAIAVMLGGGMAFVAPAAIATPSAASVEGDPDSCADINMSTGNGDCVDVMSANAESHTTDKAVAAVGTKGKILTRYQVAAGIKLKRSEKRGCPTVSQASKIPRGANCIWGSRGFKYTNSGPDMNGNLVKWSDYVGSPGSSTPGATKMKFVKRGGQWLKAGTPSGDGNCANKVWFHGPKPKLNWRQVINIRSFANWIFKGNVAVQASALSKAMAKAWCNTSNTHAEAEAEGEGEAAGRASARYKLRGLTKIRQWTNAQEAELHQEIKLQIDAEAKAKARAEAKAKAHAKVECTETEQPPTYDECTNIPGDQPPGYECYPPPSAMMPIINDVLEYNSRTVTYTLAGNPGETLQVVADAKHGGSITAGKTQSITLDGNGNATGTVTFAAGEVPKAALEYYIGSTKYTIAAGKDVVWIQVRDSHGNTVWAKSNDFDITPRPATP